MPSDGRFFWVKAGGKWRLTVCHEYTHPDGASQYFYDILIRDYISLDTASPNSVVEVHEPDAH